ncbi:MAG: peptidoglycan editing factor PgeF [Bacillota bacterium]|nr:peptidoglycan editing factor PgeF [Bacillota bacterium]MDI7249367.1 peptidoglycan editing factor PgeF [Bacillota bacterium]
MSFVRSEDGGVPVLRIRPLEEAGCLALFTLRPLGFAPGPLHTADEVRQARAALTLACLPRPAVVVRQVHGTTVLPAGPMPGADPHAPDPGEWSLLGEADGMVTGQPGLPLAVFCADCAPVYLYDPTRRVVALLHAGWRGTVGGVVERGLEAMGAVAGTRPADVLAAVGPAIGGCCYQVGEDVRARVEARLGEEARRVLERREGKLYLDLAGTISLLLQRAGVPESRVYRAGLCTACHPDLFWSHRRDGGVTGRMAAVLARRT